MNDIFCINTRPFEALNTNQWIDNKIDANKLFDIDLPQAAKDLIDSSASTQDEIVFVWKFPSFIRNRQSSCEDQFVYDFFRNAYN
jgi:hypothetical protein